MRRLRKKLTALLLALPALLCACAGKPAKQDLAQPALDFRQALLENGCSFEAEITADFEDYVYSFTLSCEEDSDGSMQMRILGARYACGHYRADRRRAGEAGLRRYGSGVRNTFRARYFSDGRARVSGAGVAVGLYAFSGTKTGLCM